MRKQFKPFHLFPLRPPKADASDKLVQFLLRPEPELSLFVRVNPASASRAPQVYLEYLEVKVCLDQRETLVSLVALVHLDDLDLMAVQELKVFLSPE